MQNIMKVSSDFTRLMSKMMAGGATEPKMEGLKGNRIPFIVSEDWTKKIGLPEKKVTGTVQFASNKTS